MSDNTQLPGSDLIASDDIAGVKYQRFKLTLGADGVNAGDVSDANPVPVAGAFYPATQPVSIAAPVTVANPTPLGLTDTQLRATAVPVALASTTVSNFPTTQAVSGTVTVANPTAQGLTDAQLRASAVPVALASVAVSNFPTTVEVSNFPAGGMGLTDTELRATAVPVTMAGAATEATLSQFTSAVRATDSPYTNGDNGVFVLAKRRDEDSTMVADGDYSGLNLDEMGRLKVATQPGTAPAKVQAITASAQTVPLNVERASNVTISMVAASLVGHAATFEYSNNSTTGLDGNWYVIQVVRSNANTVETATGTLTSTPVYGWEASVNAYKWFRVRVTAHTSGTATYTILPGSYATEPIPAVQVTGTQPVSGTVTANLGNPLTNIINSAASTNGTIVKAASSLLFGIVASNSGASPAYVKIHNSATVTAGTTAVAMWVKVPAGEAVAINCGPLGARLAIGTCLSITGAVADNDTTAVAAGQVKVIVSYL